LKILRIYAVFGSASFEKPPQTIGDLKKLRSLKIDSVNMKELPSTMINLKKLDTLEIDSAQFKEFPDIIFDLKNLKSFRFSNNLKKLKIPRKALKDKGFEYLMVY